MSDTGGSPPPADEAPQATEHLNIKVTDNASEVFFKIKRSTQLKKLMDAFCERSGKSRTSVRFLFDGQRVQDADSPDTVSFEKKILILYQELSTDACTFAKLDMADGDTLEVHQEQIGGC